MKNLTYSNSGVDYSQLDFLKRLAQEHASNTTVNLQGSGFDEVSSSRGESAYVLDAGDHYLAFVQEGLGTKNLVADQMSKITGKSYYDSIAQDTVAMIVNDLITVGAKPTVVMAYWAVGSTTWFENKKRMEDLARGWSDACNLAGVVWGGGETPTLSGIIKDDEIDLAGSAVGVIKPNSRLITGQKLQEGDAIVVFESSGIHANGLTLARKIAEKLPEGFASKLSSGLLYGQALLVPTIIYSRLIQDILEAGVDIHYLSNITGHGWRKLMRADRDFTYRINSLPPVPEVFKFIADKGPVSEKEMYSNFNMGAGFAIFVPEKDVEKVIKESENHKIKAYKIGTVEKGKKQTILEPFDMVFASESLFIRI